MNQLSDTERLAWLRLARTEGIGPINFHKLVRRYGTATKAIAMLPDLMTKAGANRGLAVTPAEQAEREIAATAKAGATLVCMGEPIFTNPSIWANSCSKTVLSSFVRLACPNPPELS